MNKKFLTGLFIFLGISCLLFAVTKDRKAINDFLAEYETLVVKAEKAAATNKLSDLTNLSLEASKFAEKAQNVQDTNEWTLQDSTKYLNLTNRYSTAVNKISGATVDTAASTEDLLKSYGF